MHDIKENGFPGGTVVKSPPANAGGASDMGFILGSGSEVKSLSHV